MTIRLTKVRLALAVAAVVALVPATAVATHVFTDVDDSRFFAAAVEWASENGITTGTTATTFEPDRGVTRGETVTFLKRYDDNVVQPALVAAKGEKGDPGTPAWGNIPSGVTVTGNYIFDIQSDITTGDYRMTVQMPGLPPVALTDTTVNFAADASALTTDDDASCTGSSAAPTAPAGKVCVYVFGSLGVSGLNAVAPFGVQGAFVVRWAPASMGDQYVNLVWAYTAP